MWAKLNDRRGAQGLHSRLRAARQDLGHRVQAIATIKIGPVKAKWKGKVHLTDLDPPNGYKISGEGEGGVAGFAKGGAVVTLTDKDGGTLLTYNVEAQIGGKLAQLGQRLIAAPRRRSPMTFSTKFAAAVAGGAAAATSGDRPARRGTPP